MSLKPALSAGATYFLAVFLCGFVLGVVRMLVLQPLVGPLAAVAIELPFILAFSWMACHKIIRAFRVPQRTGQLRTMGNVAFALLMASELLLSEVLNEGGAAAWLRGLTTPEGILGISGQFLFGLMPIMASRASLS
eukprot:CAMPEP_0177583004 /NCGR_PEP_ID=MMETSP0419_2-20121207/3073_1 /TAXON_ID=582737 /ORGANISM="Tetraselmis sp., Strain GSL018" /LENGTH=135 /DNA_ID=CAMNT_0019072331 /DNA_START=202 /DNA_END=609 /DNA_ORIENTATION=+